MTEVIAVLIGAIAAGIIQTIISRTDKRNRRDSMLVAIASEVDSLCRLIRHQQYLEAFSEQANHVRTGTWDGQVWFIDIRCNYFSVYEALSSQLGELPPIQVSTIVNFYSYCKAAIDSTRLDGPMATDCRDEDKKSNLLSVEAILHSILQLGDQIVQFPKHGLVRVND